MTSELVKIILASDSVVRDRALETACAGMTVEQLLSECDELDRFRRTSENLYERVRALFFLYAIHRFHLPAKLGSGVRGLLPFEGYEDLLNRRFNEAIDI